MRVLDTISLRLDLDEVRKELRLNGTEKPPTDVRELMERAESLIHPKAVYEVSYIGQRGEVTVEVDGVILTSRVLRMNLNEVERVFPFIITIGGDLEDRASSSGDILNQFYLESLGNLALRCIRTSLEDHLKRHFGLGQLSRMSPGSLPDWPITEQKPLFTLFGDVEKLIGVRLNENMLMIPRKSVSGIFFPTEVLFVSCQLCPRNDCPGRRAPYDEALRVQYGLDDA